MSVALRNPTGLASIVGESDPDYLVKATPYELQADSAARRTAGKTHAQVAHEQGVKPEISAKYKIEVTFTHSRKPSGDNSCGIQVWESGRKFHGGGDDLMFVCKDITEPDPRKQQGCGNFVSSDDVKNGMAYCRKCQKAMFARKMGRMYTIPNRPLMHIADMLVVFFRQLGSNADIYLKFHKTDIRYIAMEKAYGTKKASDLKGMHYYALKNIIKDTSAGADLGNRFLAFITS